MYFFYFKSGCVLISHRWGFAAFLKEYQRGGAPCIAQSVLKSTSSGRRTHAGAQDHPRQGSQYRGTTAKKESEQRVRVSSETGICLCSYFEAPGPPLFYTVHVKKVMKAETGCSPAGCLQSMVNRFRPLSCLIRFTGVRSCPELRRGTTRNYLH